MKITRGGARHNTPLQFRSEIDNNRALNSIQLSRVEGIANQPASSFPLKVDDFRPATRRCEEVDQATRKRNEAVTNKGRSIYANMT